MRRWGWFDAFRTEGGPTLYSYSNRTPVTGDPSTIVFYVIFATLAFAFLIIFPGIRKQRFTTFWSVALSLFVGSAILVCQYGSDWHVAETHVHTLYRAFSRDLLKAHIGVHIGLTHFNVTLQGLPYSISESTNSTFLPDDIDFNERFHWIKAGGIQEELRSALFKGLPYPILTVVEYFSLDDEGFCWGREYRQGGYYAGILLWASFASWLLMNLLIVTVPRYGAYQMVLTGALLLTTNFIYIALIPIKPPIIRFEETFLQFQLGTSYWVVLAAGSCCVFAGSVIAIIDLIYPHKFSTVLEVDYDTPYDRHMIIEESHDTRKKKGRRSLEEPDGLGKRILRTLSKRSVRAEDDGMRLANTHIELRGNSNEAFQMDENPQVPNSPWRVPHHQMARDSSKQLRGTLATAFAKNPALLRLAAPNPKGSPKSVSFRRQSKLETTYTVEDRRKDSSSSSFSDTQCEDPPTVSSLFQSHVRGVHRSESTESHDSSISSYGLGLLSRQASSVNTHQAASRKKSSSSGGGARHLPLQRMIHQYPKTIELPRAAIQDRKSSTEDSSRRDSGSSHASSKASVSSTNPSKRQYHDHVRRDSEW